MVNSKRKGAGFERELARALTAEGYKCHRSAQYCGKSGEAADVIGLPYIHIEAKKQEKMRLYEWYAQAKRDAKEGLIPAVFHKANYKPMLVTLSFEDFMEIYREYEASRRGDTDADI